MYMYVYMYMWLHACMLSVYHYYIIASAHVHACSRCMACMYIHALSRRDDSKSLTIKITGQSSILHACILCTRLHVHALYIHTINVHCLEPIALHAYIRTYSHALELVWLLSFT